MENKIETVIEKQDSTAKKKATVHYAVTPFTNIVVGQRALVVPMDHPDTVNVPNGFHAYTSEVIVYNSETGEFETQNNRYVPN